MNQRFPTLEFQGKPKKHTKTVKLLKSDLDQVFSRIRGLKTKIRAKYPELLEQAEKEELEKMPPPPDE